MSNGTYGFIGFILGAGVGIAGTYIFMKNRYDELLTSYIDDDEDYSYKFSEEEELELVNPNPEVIIGQGARTKEQYTNYSKMYSDDKKEGESMDTDEIMEEEVEIKVEASSKSNDILEIDSSEFGSVPLYDQESIMYYEEDGTITDERDNIIDNPTDIVGSIIEDSGFDNDERESMFIRNLKLATEYEIIKIHSAYDAG